MNYYLLNSNNAIFNNLNSNNSNSNNSLLPQQQFNGPFGGDHFSIITSFCGAISGVGQNSYLEFLDFVPFNDLIGRTLVKVSGGRLFSILLMSDGTIYGFGYNGNGEFGIGNIDDKENDPNQFRLINNTLPIGKKPVSVSCGEYHTILLMSDGTIYVSGYNGNGELGIGNNHNPITSFTLMNSVPHGKTPVQICCGRSYTLVLMSDGTIYGTGYNGNGSLGLGNTDIKDTNTLTLMSTVPIGKTPVSISCGYYHTIVLMSDGTIYGTGCNTYGQLGIANNVSYVKSLTLMTNNTGKTPISIFASHAYTIVYMSDGTIYGIGLNSGYEICENSKEYAIRSLILVDNTRLRYKHPWYCK